MVQAADLDAIHGIVAHLQGHPLALGLAVPLARDRGLARVWRELQARPLQGVAAAFELSYARLTPLQRRLFAALGVLAVPFEWTAAAALLPGEEGLDDALDALVRRALVAFDGARYAYHALLRQYAYEKLAAGGDPRPVHRRAAEYLAEKGRTGVTPEEALEAVDQWERAEAWVEFAESAGNLVSAGGRVSLDSQGYWGEIRARLARALGAVRAEGAGAAGLEAELLHGIAAIALKSGAWDEALTRWTEAAKLYEAVGDDRGLAAAYNNLGSGYLQKGAWDRAIAFYQQAAEAFERLGDALGLAETYNNLGSGYLRKGAWDRAIAFYQQAMETFKRLGDAHGLAQTYNNLGEVYRTRGEWDRAIAFYRQAAEALERLSDAHGLARIYGNLGIVYAQKGEWDRAIAFYQQAVEISERLGDAHGLARTYGNLGSFYQAQGDVEQAARYMARAYLIFARLGAAPEAQQAGRLLVNILGSVEAAEAYLAEMQEE